jgi:hypothetical protein
MNSRLFIDGDITARSNLFMENGYLFQW